MLRCGRLGMSIEKGKRTMEDSQTRAEIAEVFGRLVGLIQTLRSENGCPWDRKQTSGTFHHYILEEYHEMVQAMNSGDTGEIVDEAGDLIFLVIFVAYMFEQEDIGTLTEMMEGVIQKMTRRHPHVFGDTSVRDAADVVDNWRKIKAGEENIRRRESLLDGIPRSLPALNRAQRLARRAATVGFDWTRPEEVLVKIDEELTELKQAIAVGVSKEIREELGDLLFVMVNAARHLDINSESALNETSDKFERRFRHIEARLRSEGKSLEDANLEEMDRFWDEAKRLEKEKNV